MTARFLPFLWFSFLLLAGCGGPRRSDRAGPPPDGGTPAADAGIGWPTADAGAVDADADGGDARADAAVEPPTIGLILPLSGRSHRLGEDLAEVALALAGGTAEDRPAGTGPRLVLRDGGDPETVREAIAALVSEEGAFAAVGLFDRTVADAAAEAAGEHDLPLVMLTLDDAPDEADGLVWRALHTPALVARTIAGAGLARGGREAAVFAPRNGYGRTLGTLFRGAWEAGGGRVAATFDWDPAAPDWEAVAREAADTPFDTLFIADGPVGAALLLTHLAAEKVWSRAHGPRFDPDAGVREVLVLGTPEWYEPRWLAQAGRYLEGALVPVPFAVETAPGRAFAGRVEALVGRSPTVFDALLADAVAACRAAHERHVADGLPVAEAFATVRVEGVTSGLRFDRTDAVQGLYVLRVRGGMFEPVRGEVRKGEDTRRRPLPRR